MSKRAALWSGDMPDSEEEARNRLLDAFLEVMLTRGYQKTTMSAVASAAGVTRPTLYKHFDNKSALYTSAVIRLFEDYTRRAAVHISRYRSSRQRLIQAALYGHRHMASDSLFASFLRQSRAPDAGDILPGSERRQLIDGFMKPVMDAIVKDLPALESRRRFLTEFIVRLTISMVYEPFRDEKDVIAFIENTLLARLDN